MVFLKRIKRGDCVYLAEVKSVREGSRVRHEFIRYVGKEVDNKTVLSGSIERAEITKVSIHGPLLVLHDIATRLGLPEIFGDYAPYILSLAYAHCVEPGSLSAIEKWYEQTDLNHLLSLEKVTYDRLLDAMDSLEADQKRVQRKMFQAARSVLGLAPKGVFYDVTNVYFYGCQCPLAKKGYNKDGMDTEQIHIGLAVTKDEKIPVFHQVFEGNIHDARTLQTVFDEFDASFIKKAYVVWDRGVTSKTNVIAARKAGFEVVCGMPMQGKVKTVVDTILKMRNITQFKNRIALTKSTLFAIQRQYSYGKTSGYLTVCFNEKDKVSRKEARYKIIQEALKKKKTIPPSIRKYLRYGKVDQKKLEQGEKYDGYSVIFSTQQLPPQETVDAYFEKDVVEKTFRSLKTTLEIRPIRHWLAERVKAHVLICYIAYYLLSILEYQLRALDITAPHAIELLKTVYRIHMVDPKTKNRFVKTVTLTKEQEKILRAVNKKLLKCSQ